jgi:hypothetical protein
MSSLGSDGIEELAGLANFNVWDLRILGRERRNALELSMVVSSQRWSGNAKISPWTAFVG